MKPGYIWALFLLNLILVLLVLISLINGSVHLTIMQTLSALHLGTEPIGDMMRSIVFDIRLPRVLLAIMTGAGLAVVGSLLQTTTRNELADPFLFGLSSGASVGAVLVITHFGSLAGFLTLPIAAFCGGVISSLAVILLFHFKRGQGSESLILYGLACSFIFGAITSYLVFSGDQRAASSILFWSLGGLGLARWDNLIYALISLLILFVLVLFRGRSLDGLLAGDYVAHSLGIDVKRLRIEVFLCCAFATSLLVSLTGVIGFIGLMIPNLCRLISGVNHYRLLPLCALAGAVFMCVGDLLSRTLLAPQELPVGIITAGIGGGFIIFISTKRGNR
ncbi:TPA: iron ABC transporter permease [Vibrio vulnificus]|nr:iron ABC transporter permease [Vibrio vulnificus]